MLQLRISSHLKGDDFNEVKKGVQLVFSADHEIDIEEPVSRYVSGFIGVLHGPSVEDLSERVDVTTTASAIIQDAASRARN